jgi:hypothetical protein
MHNIAYLYEFIDRAVRNRNYPQNTALGLKAALKRFEAEANEEERSSVEKFKDHLEQIYREVVLKNKDFNAESLRVYKSRVTRVINDFERYGIDPTKMANWTVKVPVRDKTISSRKSKEKMIEDRSGDEPELTGTHRIEHPLSYGKVVISLPKETTQKDIEKIKKLLDLVEVKE